MVDSILNQLNALETGFDTEAVRIIEDNAGFIIDMNLETLYSGYNSKGQSLDSIGGSYSPVTIQIKREKGQVTSHVTLKDTGSFYDGFFLKASDGLWKISSTDDKTQGLIRDWGADIFGNTEMDEQEINIRYILPGLIEWIMLNLSLRK